MRKTSLANSAKVINLAANIGKVPNRILVPKARTALLKSIAHWKNIVKSVEVDTPLGTSIRRVNMGTKECALCELFLTNKPEARQCQGCPVQQKTHRIGCCGSPFREARNAYDLYLAAHHQKRAAVVADLRKKAIAATNKELKFLEGLLTASDEQELALYKQNLKSVNQLIKEAGKLKDTILVYLDKHGCMPANEQRPVNNIRIPPVLKELFAEAAKLTPKPVKNSPHVRKAIKALEESIDHWQRLTDNKALTWDLPVGVSTCALCRTYLNNARTGCRNCPVKLKTGQESCINTPYTRAATAYKRVHGWLAPTNASAFMQRRNLEELKKEGQAEVDFLKEVLQDVKSGKIVIPAPKPRKPKKP